MIRGVLRFFRTTVGALRSKGSFVDELGEVGTSIRVEQPVSHTAYKKGKRGCVDGRKRKN